MPNDLETIQCVFKVYADSRSSQGEQAEAFGSTSERLSRSLCSLEQRLSFLVLVVKTWNSEGLAGKSNCTSTKHFQITYMYPVHNGARAEIHRERVILP